MYETIRKIKGQPAQKVNILKDKDQMYASMPDIAEKLARTFCQTLSNENYTQEFLPDKTTVEQEGVNFESNNSEHCNRPFTLQELQYYLGLTKNTVPHDDGIHYLMLKRMPEVAKEYMYKMFNKMWQQSYFPDKWNIAIVIPIHKPGKNSTDSRNYRPIALTSCICKLFELTRA